ncbi:MAG: hypothetical protein ABI180_15460 [Microcoleus sp.]
MKRDRGEAVRADISTWRRGSLPGLMVIVAVMMARLTGALQFLELVAFGSIFAAASP